MSDNNIIEQFKLLQRAKKIESMGNASRALEMYLELHENFEPNTSDAYERPAVLLERFKRYDEAIAMCQKAIEGIKNDTLSGTIEKFEKRIEGIREKLKEEPAAEDHSSADAYVFHVLGFYQSKKLYKFIFAFYYLFAIIISIFFENVFLGLGLITILYAIRYFIDACSLNIKSKKTLALLSFLLASLALYSFLQWPQAFKGNIIFEETTEALEGGEDIFLDTESIPTITEAHLLAARKEIEKDRAVIESAIIVNGLDVTFGLVLWKATDKKESKALLENFAKYLSDIVAEDNDIKASSDNSFGELYNYYHIYATATTDQATLLVKGSKNTKSKYILWDY
jgi:tetratricopeptide (TPR) repeat protein